LPVRPTSAPLASSSPRLRRLLPDVTPRERERFLRGRDVTGFPAVGAGAPRHAVMQQAGAGHVPGAVGLAGTETPQRVLHRTDQRPGADPGGVQGQLAGELLDQMVKACLVGALPQGAAEQVAGVEGALARERLWGDP